MRSLSPVCTRTFFGVVLLVGTAATGCSHPPTPSHPGAASSSSPSPPAATEYEVEEYTTPGNRWRLGATPVLPVNLHDENDPEGAIELTVTDIVAGAAADLAALDAADLAAAGLDTADAADLTPYLITWRATAVAAGDIGGYDPSTQLDGLQADGTRGIDVVTTDPDGGCTTTRAPEVWDAGETVTGCLISLAPRPITEVLYDGPRGFAADKQPQTWRTGSGPRFGVPLNSRRGR